VGSILVIAMLIVPAATAQLLTHRLGGMLAVASLVAASSTVFGYAGALAWNTSTAGMIAVAGGAQFLLAVIFAPGQGLVSRLISNAALGVRVSAEDLLARLYRAEEREGRGARLAWSARTWRDWLAEGRVARSGWAQREGSRKWVLTDAGRAQAAGVIRAHRLWESYLDRNFDLPVDHLHDAAERMEHYIGPILQETLSESLPVTQSDPHGRRIPPPTELSR
jgi:Mn-dependent DtxR family transcriptional regulator